MSIFTRRPREDVETERARLMTRVDVRGHEKTVERIRKNAEREDRLKRKKQKRADRIDFWTGVAKTAGNGVAALRQKLTLILPLLLINSFAVVGQAGWASDHFGWGLLGSASFAATLESIALYIGYHAHAALMAGDSAMKLRLASYAVGAAVGGINYDHYCGPHGKPTAMAVVFGLLSLISPWLWAMHGRYKNRRRLEQLGLIDERAPHFSAAKWIHFPIQTMGALRHGIAHNVKDPAAAWDGYQAHRAAVKTRRELAKSRRPKVAVTVVRVVDYTFPAPKTALRLYRVHSLATTYDQPSATTPRPVDATTPPSALPATATTGHDHTDTTTRDRDHRLDATTNVSTPEDRTRTRPKTSKTGRVQVDTTSKPQPTEEDKRKAIALYLQSVRDGKPLSKRALAKQMGFSPSWALKCIQEAGPRPVGSGNRDRVQVDATTPKDHPVTSEVKTG